MARSNKHKAESVHKVHKSAGAKAKRKQTRPPDDFVSVARRLGADEDKAKFEAKLAKIAKAKSKN